MLSGLSINTIALTACSISFIVAPAGRWAAATAVVGGSGMTSEQSIMSLMS